MPTTERHRRGFEQMGAQQAIAAPIGPLRPGRAPEAEFRRPLPIARPIYGRRLGLRGDRGQEHEGRRQAAFVLVKWCCATQAESKPQRSACTICAMANR
jgi:hypothetical protein